MENSEKKKSSIKKIVVFVVLGALIVTLVGLAFLPSVRNGGRAVVASGGNKADAEAMRVLSCCAAYVQSNDFSTEIKGEVKARVFGVPYTQSVRGNRQIQGDDFRETAESVSVFAKAGIKKSRTNGRLSVAHGKYKDKHFEYSDGKQISKDEYVAAYGKPYIGLVRYETDNAVVSAECVGENTYKYVLDPRRATSYTSREVKTMLASDTLPEYESVEFILVTDGERPVCVTSTERFRVDKLGGTHCVAKYEERFIFN